MLILLHMDLDIESTWHLMNMSPQQAESYPRKVRSLARRIQALPGEKIWAGFGDDSPDGEFLALSETCVSRSQGKSPVDLVAEFKSLGLKSVRIAGLWRTHCCRDLQYACSRAGIAAVVDESLTLCRPR